MTKQLAPGRAAEINKLVREQEEEFQKVTRSLARMGNEYGRLRSELPREQFEQIVREHALKMINSLILFGLLAELRDWPEDMN